MAKRREITVVGYFVYPDGKTVPMDSIPKDEMLEINKEWIRRWERNLSEVYQKYPEALAALPEVSPERREAYYELFPENRPKEEAI